MTSFEWFWMLPVLFATGLAAGFVDAMAGGGGLITLPVLLSLGLSPQDALGTNKLQATFGSSSATWHYARAGLIDFRGCVTGMICTGIGAVGGALCVQRMNPDILRRAIPWLLLAIALYLLVRPKLGLEDEPARMNAHLFHVSSGLLIGFYDGFFGPGTGTFWAMAYVFGMGFGLIRATAYTKVMNATSNVVSLAMFVVGNHVMWVAGLAMGLGQLLGARLGSRAVIRRGARFVRPIFIGVVLAITLSLLFRNVSR